MNPAIGLSGKTGLLPASLSLVLTGDGDDVAGAPLLQPVLELPVLAVASSAVT
jgi:hypothetical protein